MKRYNCRKAGLASLVCLGVCISAAVAQQAAQEREYYWYCHNKKITFGISTTKMAVIFEDDAADARKQDLAGSDAAIALLAETRDSKGRVQMVELKPGLAKADVEAAVARAALLPGVRFVTPILTQGGQDEFLPNGDVIVRFAPEATEADIASLNAERGVTVGRKYVPTAGEPDPKEYVLRVANPKGAGPLAVTNRFHDGPRVLWAEPDGYCLSLRLCAPGYDHDAKTYTPYDPYFELDTNDLNDPPRYQWSLHQDSSDHGGGHDIQADKAWYIHKTGLSSIVTAILDVGCNLGDTEPVNPDISFWTNAQGKHGYDFVDMDDNPQSGSAHGLGCAGVAAAKMDNLNDQQEHEGISGICGGSQIMVIRMTTAPTSGFALNSRIRDAIDYAWQNGADVLSNSWARYGTGDAALPPNDPGTGVSYVAIEGAIDRAKYQGRGGKGCPVVFAAGNGAGDPLHPDWAPVAWPARYKNAIAVGATKRDDVVESYSCYGPSLDIAAPTYVWSTTNLVYQYNATTKVSEWGVYSWGGGTSMATPHVAGVAGLLIAKDPTLTANQIQAIMQFSSDDKGGTGRDVYYGYGRLNAYNALTLAMGPRALFNGSSNLHKGSVYTEDGHLVVEDKVIGSATSGQLTPSTSDVWVLRDNTTPTPLVIARLTSAGTLYLKGAWYEKETSLSPPSGSPLVFRKSSSVVTAYIDLNGNLKVKGRIFMGNDPDRDSQGT